MTNSGHCSAVGNAARKLGLASSARLSINIVTETIMPGQNQGANSSKLGLMKANRS